MRQKEQDGGIWGRIEGSVEPTGKRKGPSITVTVVICSDICVTCTRHVRKRY